MAISLFILLLISSSCGQLSSLQTAKVVGKNKATIGGAVFGYGVNDDNANGGELGDGIFPHAEFFGRYGLSNTVDMGLKISTSGNALLDAKYQIVGNAESAFALALGGGFEYQGTNVQESIVFRTHLPLYLSFHPSENSAIYLAPRYVFQYVSSDNNSYFLGGSMGYNHRFTERFSGLIEGSYYRPFTENANNEGLALFQFGVGFAYHF